MQKKQPKNPDPDRSLFGFPKPKPDKPAKDRQKDKEWDRLIWLDEILDDDDD